MKNGQYKGCATYNDFRELLGRKDVRLYYGSMVDWTSDATHPLASARTKWDDLKKTLGFGS